MKKEYAKKFLRLRRLLLVLPVIVEPFLFAIFSLLGGGKGGDGGKNAAAEVKGFNKELPSAHFDKKEQVQDKMGYYERAEADSTRWRERERMDPYRRHPAALSMVAGGHPNILSGITPIAGTDTVAEALAKKLEFLRKAIRDPASVGDGSNGSGPHAYGEAPLARDHGLEERERLDMMLRRARTVDTAGPDTKMDRWDGMLDKILRIQGGGKMEEGRISSSKDSALPVMVAQAETAIRDAETGMADAGETLSDSLDTGGFYSTDDPAVGAVPAANLISAVVTTAQTVVAGSTLEMRLASEASMGGVTLPKGNLLSGKVSWQNDRLMVSVTAIRYGSSEFPVSLRVFDMDGLEGLNIPGSINRDLSKESLNEGIGSVGLTTLDPSFGSQMAGAGAQAAKSLLGRRAKLVRGVVPAGYRVFLQNTKK